MYTDALKQKLLDLADHLRVDLETAAYEMGEGLPLVLETLSSLSEEKLHSELALIFFMASFDAPAKAKNLPDKGSVILRYAERYSAFLDIRKDKEGDLHLFLKDNPYREIGVLTKDENGYYHYYPY